MRQMKEERIQEMVEILESLPENWQNAIVLLARNYDYFVELCGYEPIPRAQREAFLDDAIQKDDALMILLLIMERRINGDTSC